MSTSASHDGHSFLKGFIGSVAVLLLLTAGFCALIDPFALFPLWQQEGWNKKKFGYFMREPLIKRYQLKQWHPDALILGNSVANASFDLSHPYFNDRHTYSLGVAGIGIYGNARMLQDASAEKTPEQLLWLFDFWNFFGNEPSNHRAAMEASDFGRRLTIKPNGDPNHTWYGQAARDMGLLLLSWDAVFESLDTLREQQRQGWHLQRDGSWGGDPEHAGKSQQKSFQYIEKILFEHAGKACQHGNCLQTPAGEATLEGLILGLRWIHQHGIPATLAIPPAHARWYEAFHAAGLWQEYRQWKLAVVDINHRIAAEYNRPPLTLIDFSGYHALGLETVPDWQDKSSRMEYFNDDVHFTRKTGTMMLDTLHGQIAQPDFGLALTAENVAQQLNLMEQQHWRYAATNPADIQAVEQSCSAKLNAERCLTIRQQRERYPTNP